MSLNCKLNGQLAFVTDREGFEQPMELNGQTWNLAFSEDRQAVDASAFEPMKIGPFPIEFGPLRFDDVLTVKLLPDTSHDRSNGIGSFNPISRSIEIPLRLRFKHSLALAAPSTLSVTLSTENMGELALAHLHGEQLTPGEPPATLTLLGSGRFSGGALDGRRCTLAIKGLLDPSPLHP